MAAPTPVLNNVADAYTHFLNNQTNVHEHYAVIRALARECESVTELGADDFFSAWPLLKGMSDNGDAKRREYVAVDRKPCSETFDKIKQMALQDAIRMQYIQGSSLNVKIQDTDLLLIDTFHAYPQLKKELERHHKRARKYIVLLNTETDGEHSELVRLYYYYDIDKMMDELACSEADICVGLKPAIAEFLVAHHEWGVHAEYKNNNGMIVLKRKE
jgi:hypothetical protein